MTALLITSFVILLAYVFYVIKQVGVTASLSESYYKVKHKWLFQVAMGITGLLMMIVLLDVTAGKWYQFLSFFSTSALIFVAFAPDYKQMMEGKVHASAAYTSAAASLVLIVLMGYWYVPVLPFLASVFIIRKWGNKTFWLEMACFASIFITSILL